MFTGWSTHILDAKGRLAIPARFRDVLRGNRDEQLVITASDRCLVAYPYEEWRGLADRVSRLSQFDRNVQAFRRYFISGAVECAPDKQGRILIPPALREHAALNGSVHLAGMQNNFEIWDKDRWVNEHQAIGERFAEVSEAMAELGI